MAGVKLHIHPLMYLFGLYFALTGRIFIFIIYTLVALVHELGHSFIAEKLGYRLNEIMLMPFGAVIKGNISGLKFKDEVAVSLGGILFNIITAIIFIAVWWLFPLTYTYTEQIVLASVTLAVINLLPVFPLDGGRIILALLSLSLSEKVAKKICFIIAMLFTGLFIALFIITIFKKVNFTLLFFGLFILFGNLFVRKEDKYIKLYSEHSSGGLMRGKIYRKQAISGEADIKTLINILDPNYINEIDIYLGKKKIKHLKEDEVFSMIEKNSIYDKIKDCISSF